MDAEAACDPVGRKLRMVAEGVLVYSLKDSLLTWAPSFKRDICSHD